jgi:tripartite-type tricarboxylate transporter receptor subunit TctC
VQDATATPSWQGTLAKMGWAGEFLGGDAFRDFLEQDTKRIAGIIDSLGIRK